MWLWWALINAFPLPLFPPPELAVGIDLHARRCDEAFDGGVFFTTFSLAETLPPFVFKQSDSLYLYVHVSMKLALLVFFVKKAIF